MAQSIIPPAWFRYPSYSWNTKHVVVIGAGIAGCQIAWHLAKQGWEITLIERESDIAQQASGNPAGIISPKMTAQKSTGEDFYVDCFNYAIQQLSGLQQQDNSLDWHPCGLLQLAHNNREQQRWESLKLRGFHQDFLQLIDQDQSSKIAGIPLNHKASYFPQAGWIDPASFCKTLLKNCAENCSLILNSDVISLKKESNNWQIFDQNNQLIRSSEVVIVTSGKDLNLFLQTNKLPSMPVAGQTSSALNNSFAGQLRTTIGHEGYLTPASTDTKKLTFGASFQRNIDKPTLSAEIDKENLNQLHKYLPELADSFSEVNSAHVAVRMTTPDRFPYVGGIADTDFYIQNYADLHQGKQYKEYPNAKYIEGLFVLGGLGSRGLTTSGLCAKVLSNILNNHPAMNSLQQQCHPSRFIIKDLKRQFARN